MTTTPTLPPLPDDGYPSTMGEIHKIERARRPTVKIEPGSEMHMIGIMSQWHLNFVVGRDREHLVVYGQAAYQAGRDAGLVAAHAVLDDVGAKLQQAHDDEDDSYWSGVGAMVQAGEEAILALKSDQKETP